MQSTGGLINDILIFAVFIYLTLLVSGKVKLRQDRQEKLDELMSRRGTLLKILAYAGTVLFAILILITLFAFTTHKRDANSSARQIQRQWTKSDKDAMTKACIQNAKASFQKDSVKTKALCACVTENYTSKYTYDQAQELNKKPQQEQIEFFQPLIKECINKVSSPNK